MRLTRVHVDLPLAVGAGFALPEAAASHLARVLRLQPGDACVLFNGDGHDYAATISAVGKREVRVRVDAAVAVGNESPLRITLVQGIARGEKMDWILQKATELGVGAVVPVSSERSEVRLDRERADKRLAHWRSVVVAACEQSGRASVPAVAPSQPLAEAMEGLDAQPRYLLDPQAARAIGALATTPLTGCVLAVGPEGGWSPRDRGLLAQAGFEGLRLGPRVLRTETAGIAAIAVLQALRGDLA
ncbi:16S rRNA (uracil(1498)-N(3))-methyltransferase [Cognatiluteimonas telluris]|jgi:16S rRNA (uracil1498-N3)-methyltransferase|uniref:16S rRNA (uracil(1498)-N(3))-methyltransferase n=1 Tax=Cognatiluteimonas telluris TaxID=1104775 RepID=UPI00140BA1CE|nr:16S rRNA (uracil(1498)-N(3))-methyltransferase [Lysobacter telluris]